MRTILITGCSTGIGHAAALACRAAGWRVFASARKAADVERLQAEGFEAVRLDLDDSASIAEALAWVLEQSGGGLDALFNNAGYGQPGAIEDLPRAAWREQFESNLFGPIELTSAVLPVMRQQRSGHIFNISSIGGVVGFNGAAIYCATKHAIEGLSAALDMEVSGLGIKVTAVADRKSVV